MKKVITIIELVKNSQSFKDFVWMGFSISFLILLTILLDAYEYVHEILEKHENWELDEGILALLIISIHSAYFSYRRWEEFKSELKIRKETEIILQKNEEKFRGITDRSFDLIFMINKSGRLTFVSASAISTLGYQPDEMIGKSVKEILAPNMWMHAKEIFTNVLRGEKALFHTILLNKSGNTINVEVHAVPIFEDGEIVGIQGDLRDITDRLEAEHLLQESEEKYRGFIENSPDIVYVFSSKRGGIFYSKRVEDIFGYTVEEMLMDSFLWNRSIHPDDANHIQMLLAAIIPGTNTNVEYRVKNSNGEWIWLQDRITRKIEIEDEIIVEGIATDITNQKKLQEEIQRHHEHLEKLVVERTAELQLVIDKLVKESADRRIAESELMKTENRYLELFNTMHEGVGLVDENENIVFCNPAYAEIFEENSIEGMVGCNLKKYILEDKFHEILTETEKRKKGIRSQYELEIVTAKGNKKTILVSVSPKFDSEHNYIGSYGAIIDLTEIKKLQELTTRAVRLESAGRIAGQVAHDFNNLLGPLIAYPGLIKDDLPDDHPSIPLINDIENAAEQIAEINNQLLTLGRRGYYKLEPLNINDIVNAEIRRIKPGSDDIHIIVNTDENLQNIMGGGSQIARVVLNLISNAIDALNGHGDIFITTENYYVDRDSGKYGEIQKGEYVRLIVKDNGCGIPKDILPQIMDPFFTTKVTSEKKGSGLGLSIVHTVLQDHGGFIDIDSKEGEGATFSLYFPVTRALTEEKIFDKLPTGTESILVVDDDKLQLDLLTLLLEKLGYKVSSVDSGEKAIEFIKDHPQDLVILDMIMNPGIGGAETFEQIVKLYHNQKAIIMSGFAENENVLKAQQLGAGGFVCKPITLERLAVAVRCELELDNKQPIII